MREQLTANRTYYVRTDGSDSNNGLANTSGGAFLTIQKAVDVVCETLDCGAYSVTIQLGNGTYTLTSSVNLYYHVGEKVITIKGDETTPSNVVVNSSTSGVSLFYTSSPFRWDINGISMSSTGTSGACAALSNGYIKFKNCRFGAATGVHISAWYNSTVLLDGTITIYGSSTQFIAAYFGSSIRFAGFGDYATIAMSGTPNFSSAYVYAYGSGTNIAAVSYQSGTATGKRYQADKLALIDVGGNGTNYLPGNVAGTTSLNAVYG